jgi:hypothetical protein
MGALSASVRRATWLGATLAGWVLLAQLGCEGEVGLKLANPAPAATRADDAGAGDGIVPAGTGGTSGDNASGPTLPDAAAPADGALVGGSQCVTESHVAHVVPVDLFILVDVSGSMLEIIDGGKTKWDLVRSALMTFFADPRSAGLGIGLQFFPLPAPCAQDRDCGTVSGVTLGDCRDRGICAPPGQALTAAATATATACDSFSNQCPDGTSCIPVRRCSRSHLPCVEAGQPCTAGMADDMCDDPGQRCVPAQADGCMPELYSAPALPVGELPGWQDYLGLTLGAVTPGGSTPMAPALAATFPVVRAQAIAHPGRKPILVLATDGFPTGCGPNTIETVAAAIAAGRLSGPALPTYVIGVFSDQELVRSQLALSLLATAGGTVVPYVINQSQDLAQKFLAALEQIRGSALACEFSIPQPKGGASLDFAKVNMRFVPGVGMPEDLFYVRSADHCDPARGGWYYDVDPATGAVPTRIRVCEPTCQRFKAETAGMVELQVGCSTRID